MAFAAKDLQADGEAGAFWVVFGEAQNVQTGKPQRKAKGNPDIFTGKTGKTPGESSFFPAVFFWMVLDVGSIGGEGANAA